MAEGWPWLNDNAWVASALLCVAFCGAAITMLWRGYETNSSRSFSVAVAGLLLLSASFVLVGVSVGTQPIVPGRALLPWIRLMWLWSALLLNGFMVLYWVRGSRRK